MRNNNQGLGELFDSNQILHDSSGSGNNWAQGNQHYGPLYHERILEMLRIQTEHCDSLQSFFIIHSLGGGTGSGLGTYTLKILEDEYPNVFRFNTPIFPQNEDDVITSPYNSMLSLNEIIKHSDCVLPVDNQALLNICEFQTKQKSKMNNNNNINNGVNKNKKEHFKEMNGIIANLLSNLTSSMRFEGTLNIDLNEITMNMVPFPSLKFLIPATNIDINNNLLNRQVDDMFKSILNPLNQLLVSNPLKSKYLAMGFLLRGQATFSDVNRNLQRIKSQIDMVYWNQDSFKYGICSHPPLNHSNSLLTLQNNTAIQFNFNEIYQRFFRLYKRKAHLHHYLDFIQQDFFEDAIHNVQDIIHQYKSYDDLQMPTQFNKLTPII